MRAATAVIGNQKAYNQIFNVGNSQSVISSLELAKLVISITNSPSQILFSKEENAPISHRVPNTQKAENVLQYKPMVHLKEGLQQTYAWYKEHQTV
jgi:dTDP-glucose 4,6-dehydratase